MTAHDRQQMMKLADVRAKAAQDLSRIEPTPDGALGVTFALLAIDARLTALCMFLEDRR